MCIGKYIWNEVRNEISTYERKWPNMNENIVQKLQQRVLTEIIIWMAYAYYCMIVRTLNKFDQNLLSVGWVKICYDTTSV